MTKGYFMGRYTVQFRCHNCGHCCTDVVCRPTVRDAVRIAAATGLDPDEFIELRSEDEIDGVDASDPTWLECGGERYLMVLRHVRGRCYFMRTRKAQSVCTIYETRPALCRLFPFKLQQTRSGEFKGFTLHDDCECPRYRDGIVETEPLYRVYLEDDENQDDLIAMVAAFNSGDHDSPDEFIDMFIRR